jgi:hypothetical protein
VRNSTYLIAIALASAALSTPTQAWGDTLLNEDFESVSVNYDDRYAEITSLEGWSTIDRDASAALPKRWCVYASGTSANTNNRAWVDASSTESPTLKGSDYLITPSLSITGPTALSFQWAASAMALDGKQFDLRVRIIEDGQDPNDVPFVFSILDPDMVIASGVQPTDYGWYSVSWVGWAKNVSTIDLSDYAGKTIRIAFEYYLDGSNKINNIELDDVKVYTTAAVSGPIATPSVSEWDFGKVYVGAKAISETFTVTNTGKDVLKITGYEAPAGFSVLSSTDFNDIALRKNETVKMQILYDATMTSASSGNIVLKTNGTDGTIAVKATKQLLPEGYSFEGFEGCESVFPPAGWKVTGNWRAVNSPIEGYIAAATTATLDSTSQDLITPRLDGTSGSLTFEFDYYDYFEDEEGYGADNTVEVCFSKDGGDNWTTLETFDYNGPYDEIIHKSYTAETDGSNNCYFKIAYMPLEYVDTENGVLISNFYIDSVILPTLYGANDAPAAPELTSPATGATSVYPRNIALSWSPALFANGYRLYVGSDNAMTNLVNGIDLADALSYTIAQADYDTTYSWKVVAYNEKGETASQVSTFRTQPDMTVKSYPYTEGFNDETFPPAGWTAEDDNYTRWYKSDISPFEGKYNASSQAGLAGTHAALTSPDFTLPETPMYISFYWGDAPGLYLKVDELGTRTNPTNGSNGIADLDFDIYADGQWTTLATLSDPSDEDNLYWYRERIDLTPYAGKTVTFRWNRKVYNYTKAKSASLDKIAIEPIESEKLSLNASEWDAMKVNWNCSFSSGAVFTVLNDGSQAATIESVSFNGSNFTTTLAPGTTIASGSGATFAVTFNAGETAAAVEDVLTIRSTAGATVTLNLKGVAMPEDTHFYGFEDDEYGSLTPHDFITIDRDGYSTVQLAMVTYANYGKPMAFEVMNYKKADWPNPYPATGDQCLVTFRPASTETTVYSDDWIIMPAVTATAQSSFEFWARNYERKDNTGYGEVFAAGNATVLVSENDDPTNIASYTQVAAYTLNYPEKEEYTAYTTNLSAYAGKKINIALRHQTNGDGLAYLFDDFTFSHFGFGTSGLSSVSANNFAVKVVNNTIVVDGVDNALLTVYATSGATVAAGSGNRLAVDNLATGVYLVNVKTAQGNTTLRFIKR